MSFPEGSRTIAEINMKVNAVEANDEIKAVSCPVDSEEGDVAVEYKILKNWKKSLSNLFRQLPRSSKSNDGDRPSDLTCDDDLDYETKPCRQEQKWQSLGKMFRRQSLVEYGRSQEYSNQYGESSSQSKRVGIKKMLTGYFKRDHTISMSNANAK